MARSVEDGTVLCVGAAQHAVLPTVSLLVWLRNDAASECEGNRTSTEVAALLLLLRCRAAARKSAV
eukprot:10575779-Alexandrium_andersonii.AAC.1